MMRGPFFFLVLYGMVLASGLAGFLLRSPSPLSPAVLQSVLATDRPGDLTNWASYRRGARVRASSYDWFHSHHPLFAIDDETRPNSTEKWASALTDRHPWIEVVFDTPHTLSAVSLVLAGVYENNIYTQRNFLLRCLLAADIAASFETEIVVKNNLEARWSSTLNCPGAYGLQVEFQVEDSPAAPQSVVRLYEIEAWGQ